MYNGTTRTSTTRRTSDARINNLAFQVQLVENVCIFTITINTFMLLNSNNLQKKVAEYWNMSHSDTTVNIIIKDTARRKGVFEVVDCHNSHLSQ